MVPGSVSLRGTLGRCHAMVPGEFFCMEELCGALQTTHHNTSKPHPALDTLFESGRSNPLNRHVQNFFKVVLCVENSEIPL
uniref:Uncharacterized protein n=1 Tax=Octopus bimaculoides TaxID=37653 RepID=A0A0L8FYW3_OCTBM